MKRGFLLKASSKGETVHLDTVSGDVKSSGREGAGEFSVEKFIGGGDRDGAATFTRITLDDGDGALNVKIVNGQVMCTKAESS